MAQLAEDAYDQSSTDAVADGWHAFTAAELGMAEKGSGSVRYTFKDGVYQGDRSGSSEGQALVLSRTIDGKSVLTIAFRGTVDLIDQYKDYFPFDNHYKTFKPLIKAVKEFVADAANGIDKVVVTGHSLGAAMAQLFLNESLEVPVRGYTFGSPGADNDRKDARLINFAHANDAIPDLGERQGRPVGWRGHRRQERTQRCSPRRTRSSATWRRRRFLPTRRATRTARSIRMGSPMR